MTVEEAMEILDEMKEPYCEGENEALNMAITALEEVQKLHAIGTVEELRELKEKATAIRANAIDEFLERLCTVCCGESMGVILGNRVKADMLTVDGVCEIAWEIAEELKKKSNEVKGE